jgi:hypothetical protein
MKDFGVQLKVKYYFGHEDVVVSVIIHIACDDAQNDGLSL